MNEIPRSSPGPTPTGAGDNSMLAFDVERVRADFPIFEQEVYGRPLVYLDSAASAQKPRQVLDAMTEAYETCYSNVHRGVHYLSQRATDRFEAARQKVAGFLNAESDEESSSPAAAPRPSTWSPPATGGPS